MKNFKYYSSKNYFNYPCAHRQWAHQGHCRFVHGYSRSFYFTFAANALEKDTYFVVDFSSLKDLEKHLSYMFDHTLLISEEDPQLETFKQLDQQGIVQLRVVQSPSMEATAKSLFDFADNLVRKKTNNRAFCFEVRAEENEKNSATYSLRQKEN